jgi:hypothetical protein
MRFIHLLDCLSMRRQQRFQSILLVIFWVIFWSLSALTFTPSNIQANESIQIPQDSQKSWRLAFAYDQNKWIRFCLKQENPSQVPFKGCFEPLSAIQAMWAQVRLMHWSSIPDDQVLAITPKDYEQSQFYQASQSNNQDQQSIQTWTLAYLLETAQATGEGKWIGYAQQKAVELLSFYPKQTAESLYWLWQYAHYVADDQLKSRLKVQTEGLLSPQAHLKAHLDQGRGGKRSTWAEIVLLADAYFAQDDLSFIGWYDRFQDDVLLRFDQKQEMPESIKHLDGDGSRLDINLHRASAFGVLKKRFTNRFDQTYGQQRLFFESAYHAHLSASFETYQAWKKQRVYFQKVSTIAVFALCADLSNANFEQHFPFKRLAYWNPSELSHLSTLPPEGVVSQGMFSKLKVTAQDSVRTLYFVRPNGDELIESRIDFRRKDLLQVFYTRDMLVNYLFNPRPQTALLIGLGGGSMVYTIKTYDPDLALDAVEIDPVVVKSALVDFGLNQALPGVQIFNLDGFDYFKQNQKLYDVIYLDAFLQPTEETDSTGNPLKLKTLAFLKDIQKHLTQTGLFVINLNDHEGLQQDIATIRAAFVETYVWEVPRTGNYIAVGLKQPFIGSFQENLKQIKDGIMPHFSFENLFERVWITQQKKANP